MPDVAIVVPWRPGVPDRERAWTWCQSWWDQFDWPVYVVEHSGTAPFSRSWCINEGARRAWPWEVLVAIDADVFTASPEQVRDGVKSALETGRLTIPHTIGADLSLRGTQALMTGKRGWETQLHKRREVCTSRVWIMRADLFEAVGGFDERFCVDTATEMLTRAGWKTCEQVTVEDEALTLNHETGMSEWQPILSVNRFEGIHEMLSIESRTHSSLTTLNHRWPVINEKQPYERTSDRAGYGLVIPVRGWATSGQHTSLQYVPIAAMHADLPIVPKYEDALVELAGWFWTEGSINRHRDGSHGRGVSISQSWEVNADKCERILAACRAAFGPESASFPRRGRSPVADMPRWREARDRRNLSVTFNAEAGDMLQNIAPNRVPSTEFLLALTQAQLDLFIAVSMAADGHARAGSYDQTLSQKSKEAAEAFAFACLLAGRACSFHTGGGLRDRGYSYEMSGVRIRQQRRFKLSRGTHTRITHEGTVWCPTTPNGTWFARRYGKTYFTGNSGWGHEDVAAFHSMRTLRGCDQLPGTCYHLWHQPSFQRARRTPEYAEGNTLVQRYLTADRNGWPALAPILAERSPEERWDRPAGPVVASPSPSWEKPTGDVDVICLTAGRKDYLKRTLASFSERIHGNIGHRTLIDDSGDEAFGRWLKETYPDWEIHTTSGKTGFTKAIRAAWAHEQSRSRGAPYIFHLEEDFTFDRDVELSEMIAVLAAEPKVAQVALLRGAFFPPELEAGGIVEEDPDAYDHRDGYLVHSKFFTTNPCLYRRSLLKFGWPNVPHSETRFTKLLVRRGYRFAFLGDGEPWCSHIGVERTGRGY